MTGFIGIGSNQGDRLEMIASALNKIQQAVDIRLIRVSSLYETGAVGPVQQPDFLNAVVQVECEMLPSLFLLYLQKIERNLGRVRTVKWGPRTIDLDILAVEAYICQTDTLVLPHPEMAGRGFVLVPFNEIAPHFVIPGTGRTVSSLLPVVSEQHCVEHYMSSTALWKMLKEV